MPRTPMNEPATRADLAATRDDLRSEISDVRSELKELRCEMHGMRDELRSEMPMMGEALTTTILTETGRMLGAMEQRLRVDLQRAVQASGEHHRHELGVVDDKYDDLPGRVARLEHKVFGES